MERMALTSSIRDAVNVLGALPVVEWRRRRLSLHQAVDWARASSRNRPSRSAAGRARLRRLIELIDARLPGGGNCVRRALLEMSLDRDSGRERLLAGFRHGGGPKSGHAWLESETARDRYDAVIAV
jgi:hypothetical protein